MVKPSLIWIWESRSGTVERVLHTVPAPRAMRFRGSGRNSATRIDQGCPEGPGDGETLRVVASGGEGCVVEARVSTEIRESVPDWVAVTNATKRPPVTAKDTPAMTREAIGVTRPSDTRSHLVARAVSMPRSEPDPLQISSLPAPHDLDSAWSGLAVVVGTGGIGSAVGTALKERCRNLTVLRCGRPGSHGNDLSLDLDDPSSFADFRAALLADGRPLRLVFNCTGRLHGPNLVPEKRLSQIDRSALPVRQASVVQHLQQGVENVGMRLFDLVEQDDLIRPSAHAFGKGTTFLVPDIAGRRSDQACDGVLLHVLLHVDPDH